MPRPLIPPSDVSREEACARWGDPLGLFPSQGAHAGAVAMWENMALWFDGEGLCRRAQLGPGSGILIDGLDVLSPPYGRAERVLCEFVPDVIVEALGRLHFPRRQAGRPREAVAVERGPLRACRLAPGSRCAGSGSFSDRSGGPAGRMEGGAASGAAVAARLPL